MSNTAITGCYKLLNPPPHHPAYLFEGSGDPSYTSFLEAPQCLQADFKSGSSS